MSFFFGVLSQCCHCLSTVMDEGEQNKVLKTIETFQLFTGMKTILLDPYGKFAYV